MLIVLFSPSFDYGKILYPLLANFPSELLLLYSMIAVIFINFIKKIILFRNVSFLKYLFSKKHEIINAKYIQK